MDISSMFQRVETALLPRRRHIEVGPPRLSEAIRFPYGPFRFKASIPKGADCSILASSDLVNWNWIGSGTATDDHGMEYVDSDASKYSQRFYRVQVGDVMSSNTVGYVSMTVPPGFSLIGNPLIAGSNTVGDLFEGWPDGTTLNKFDNRLFRLAENSVATGTWKNPGEKLMPGEGAILYNPTSDYRSLSIVGEAPEGNSSCPVPSGFSLRSCMVPQAGHICDDLGFPIAEGDVIHVFDRDRQKYVLHPYENGKWKTGAPLLSVGEAFWVAKTEPGNWTRFVGQSGLSFSH